VGKREVLVALDERGKPLDSPELARFLAEARARSEDLLFAVGGDEGHAARVREASRLVLSLSRMTLPHRLARLVLVEQLYRGFTLIEGQPYHK
jgi:23S rRNA (pseudouridine1915-N3)-methyltransferase